MAATSAPVIRESGDGKLTRRQLLQGLALTASAAAVVGAPDPVDAQTADANAKVRATLESLVKSGRKSACRWPRISTASW